MPDDLERRAIIAAHHASCLMQGCGDDVSTYPPLSGREQAIVEAWRLDLEVALQSVRKANERAETAEAEVKRLSDWKESAMTVMSGLQDLGTELGLPLGESITGTLAAETARQLRTRAKKAEDRVEQVSRLADSYGGLVGAQIREALRGEEA